jgi:hypothetical protein
MECQVKVNLTDKINVLLSRLFNDAVNLEASVIEK